MTHKQLFCSVIVLCMELSEITGAPNGSKQTKQTNKLYLTRVTLNSEITDKPVALGFQIELEFGNVGF